MQRVLLIAATSYLLGSVPFGYLLVRIFRGEDVRKSGSGNIGATNVSRKSPALGILTLLLDATKGSAAVLLASFISRRFGGPQTNALLSMAAFVAVLGHMFPVWLRFHGGKGVATALGSFAIIAPTAVLLAAGVFFLVLLLSRYVSLASIAAVAIFPLIQWLRHGYGQPWPALAFMALTSLFIVIKHHENIRRLRSGTESRVGSGGSRHA